MDFILNPFVTILTLLYTILGQNMVLAIIVFTVLIRLLTYPLTQQQMKSSKVMQELQPELKKLQEKYKDDREKLSQEQMRMYREYGVNPLGGCLPLLIQFPLLIGLYQTIQIALAATPLSLIDLSGRLLIPGLADTIPLENRWLGMNLSQPPNPLISVFVYALPLLVIVTTWLQFKVSMSNVPATSDDGKPNPMASTQQTMGTVMPLMYGFFALSFSVGMSIYFIASNVIGIVQYALMGKVKWANIIALPGRARPAVPAVVGLNTPTAAKSIPARTEGAGGAKAGTASKPGSVKPSSNGKPSPKTTGSRSKSRR